jgi:hypothetical protein
LINKLILLEKERKQETAEDAQIEKVEETKQVADQIRDEADE